MTEPVAVALLITIALALDAVTGWAWAVAFGG